MTSRLHMDAEIAKLKRQIEEMPDREATADAPSANGAPSAEPAADSGPSSGASKVHETLNDTLNDALSELGIDSDEVEELWGKLRGELEELTQNQPLLTTAGAFAAGFVLGRMSKR